MPSRLRFCRGAVDFSVFRQKVFLLILLYMALHFGAMTTAYVFATPYIDTNVGESNAVRAGPKSVLTARLFWEIGATMHL